MSYQKGKNFEWATRYSRPVFLWGMAPSAPGSTSLQRGDYTHKRIKQDDSTPLECLDASPPLGDRGHHDRIIAEGGECGVNQNLM